MGVGLSLPPTGDRASRCIETHQDKSWRDPMRVLHLSRPNQQGWIWTRHRLSATAQSSGTPLHRCARGCAYRVSIMARSRSDLGMAFGLLGGGARNPFRCQQAHSRSLRSPETSLLAIDTLPLASGLRCTGGSRALWFSLRCNHSSSACARLPIPVRMRSKNARPNLRNIPDKIIIRDNFRLTQHNYLIRWQVLLPMPSVTDLLTS